MQVSYMTMTIWINDFLSANNIWLDVVIQLLEIVNFQMSSLDT